MADTRVYTAYDKTTNAEQALIYWQQYQEMTIFAGKDGGYAVSSEAQTPLFQAASWQQTSPEEIEDSLYVSKLTLDLDAGVLAEEPPGPPWTYSIEDDVTF